MNHFLDLWPIPAGELRSILDNAKSRKAARAGLPKGTADRDAPLGGHTLAMIFEKNSTRTRVSFDMAIRQLGGTSLIISASDSQISRGETIEDTARVLSRYVDAVMMRANRHADVEAFAAAAIRAGDQRADRQVASLPDHGGPADAGRGGAEPEGRAHRLGRRWQQCCRQLHPCRAEIRLLARGRNACRVRAERG